MEEKWDGNEGTSAFHMPDWMVSSPVLCLVCCFLITKENLFLPGDKDHLWEATVEISAGKTVLLL